MATTPNPALPIVTMATAAASLVLPGSLWKPSPTLNGDNGESSSSTQLLLCSCCQESREETQLRLLSDYFRCNIRSAYVCVYCHEYITALLEKTRTPAHYIQGWKFRAPVPLNFFQRKTEQLLNSMGDAQNKDEARRLLPFVPKLAVDMIERATTSISVPMATVLILDVSGYTALAEELATRLGEGNIVGQASGAEALVSEGLNLYFETLVRTVHSYGGDVIKFAGDALICLFAPPAYDSAEEEEEMRTAARNAVFCAAIAAHTLTHVVAINHSSAGKQLTCHCGVATGEAIAWSVGDADRRELLLTGDVIRVAGEALELADSRSVVVDHRTYSLVSEWVVSHGVASSGTKRSVSVSSQPQIDKLRKVLGNPHVAVLPRLSTASAILEFHCIDSITALEFEQPKVEMLNGRRKTQQGDENDETDQIISTIDMHPLGNSTISSGSRIVVPGTIINFLARHVPRPAKELNIVNEMRRVTTVFTKIFQVTLVDNKVSLQDVFRDCKRVVETSGGLIRQFIVDDKGCVLISVFGVASYADVDDPTRALTAAVRLGHELPVPSSSGVATGVVFVGVVGWPKVRCEFAVVGDSVNLAARLMSLAAKAGERETRCDEATIASSDRIVYEELAPVMLKGKSLPTRVFNPTLAKSASLQLSSASTKSIVTLMERDADPDEFFVGRDEEKKMVRHFLSDFRCPASTQQQSEPPTSVAPFPTVISKVLIVVAQTGFGKTRLLSWIEEEFFGEACIVQVSARSNLANLVETVAMRLLSVQMNEENQGLSPSEGGDVDRSEFRASVLAKLRRRKARPSVTSVAMDDTPLWLRAKSDQGRSYSFSVVSAMSPLSPMAAARGRRQLLGFRANSGTREEPAESVDSRASAEAPLIKAMMTGGGARSNPGLPPATSSDASPLVAFVPEDISHVSPSMQHFLGANSDQLFTRLFGEENSYATSAREIPSAEARADGPANLENALEQVHVQVLEMLLLSYVRDLRTKHSRVLFVLDDADCGSDVVIKALLMTAQHTGVGLVAASRTEDTRLLSGKRRTMVRLGPISDDDIKTVVRHRFGFHECPDAVWQCILHGSRGNPLQACEWFRAILRQQFIVPSTQNKQVFILNPSKSSQELMLVTPLEGEILYAFDTALSSREKEILKKCTVVCSTDSPNAVVTTALLKSLDGLNAETDAQLTFILDRLSTSGNFADDDEDETSYLRKLPVTGSTTGTASNTSSGSSLLLGPTLATMPPMTPTPGGPRLTSTLSNQPTKYVFANEIVRNIIYRTMTFAERSKLHLKVAAWLQESRGWDLSAAPVIVHHFLSGGEKRQAFDFLRSMCGLLLKSGSFIDAIVFLKQTAGIGRSLLSQELIERNEIVEIELAIILAQISSHGGVAESEALLVWIKQARDEVQCAQQQPQSPSEVSLRAMAGRAQRYARANSSAASVGEPVSRRVNQPFGPELPVSASILSMQQQALGTTTLPPSRSSLSPTVKQQSIHVGLFDKIRSKLPSPKDYDRFFVSANISETALNDIRRFCIIQIWYAISILGDEQVLADGFNHLKATFSVTVYPTQRLFLSLLCSSLSIPLIGKPSDTKAPKFDVGVLEQTLDMALQLVPPELARLGMFATGLSLLFSRKPFVAERIARSAFTKLKDAIHAADNLTFVAAAPGAHCLQLVTLCQMFCGGLMGAAQTLDSLVSIAERLDLVKMLAWSRCTSAILQFKLHGLIPEDSDATVEQSRLMFDREALSEVDSFVAWAGMALCSRSERDKFAITQESIRLLDSKRFVWWLSDCFEATIYCGLIKRAEWTLQVLEKFFTYARCTLQLCLPIAFRLEALLRAQRGEDRLALKALNQARTEAKRLNLLYESQLCEFLYYRAFRDPAERLTDDDDQNLRAPRANSLEDFAVFGCSDEFAANILELTCEWIHLRDDATKNQTPSGRMPDERWSRARRSLRKLPFRISCALSSCTSPS